MVHIKLLNQILHQIRGLGVQPHINNDHSLYEIIPSASIESSIIFESV